MLTELSIRNFALIDHLEVNFSNGLSCLTGETGAGKSIVLGGLALVLGKRADLSTLKDKSQKCIVEATFSIHAYSLSSFFEKYDLDYASITTIRREIVPSGKSRAFINDTPVTLDVLQAIGENLIDVHSQHQTLSVTEEEYQFEVLDAIAKNDTLLAEYQSVRKAYNSTVAERKELELQKNSLLKEQDYNRFLFEELEEIKLIPGGIETLEEEAQQLANVDELQMQLSEVQQRLQAEEIGVQEQMNQIRVLLHKLHLMGKSYAQLSDRFESLVIELNDLTSEVEIANQNIESNPARLAEVNSQLHQLQNLMQKHQCSTLEELVEKKTELENKLMTTEEMDSRLAELVKKESALHQTLEQHSAALSEERTKAIPSLVDKLSGLLSHLGMPNARFKIDLVESNVFLARGKEHLSLTFSANQGSDFGPLKKVASGGELSRIMLGIKAILSQFKALPTIIFDEIDTGVSGEVGHKIADIMAHMGQYMQVITITHLPQVAAKGAHHFKIFKEVVNENTFTQLKKLSPDERVEEIAQMISGESMSATALNHARELLN